MVKVFKILAIIFVLLIGAVFIASQLVSTQMIVEQISNQTKKATGRNLAVNGAADIQFFPSLSVTLADVSFENMANSKQQQMLLVENLTLYIPWMSVFSGNFSIDSNLFCLEAVLPALSLPFLLLS